MNSSDKSASDSHEFSFLLAEQDAWALLKALDNAFPGTPGHPAAFWVKAIFACLKWCIRTLPISLLVLIVLLMFFTDSAIKMWQVVLVAIVGVIAGASMAFMLPERKLHPFVRAFMGLTRKRTMVLSRDGIRSSADNMSSFAPWSAYSEVELSNGFILMYRGRVADFIPVSVFSNPAHADDVARFIAARIKEAHCHD